MRLFLLIIYFLIISCSSTRKTSSIDYPYNSDRFLIITADDFGASKNINEGIKIAADQKVITAISVLTNFSESLLELKQLSGNYSDISIGVHLNITTGKPVLGAELVPSLISSTGNFYTIEELLPKIKSISLDDVERELRAQIVALTKYNIVFDYLSDHNGILSYYSPFYDIIIELGKEFNVPIRTNNLSCVKYPNLFPNSHSKKYAKQIAFRFGLRHPFKAFKLLNYNKASAREAQVQKMNMLGVSHPDLLIDYFWGDPSPANYLYILKHLPTGISELVLHLGSDARQANYPSGLDVDYFGDREKELKTVTDDNVKKHFNNLNIKTIGYSEITKYRIN